MAIYDALYRHARIKHILVRHEESAALMADGYSRATGKVGVCCVTSGSGVTNAATGLAVAQGTRFLFCSSPAGSLRSRQTKRGLFHAMDQLALTRPITKWNARAELRSRFHRSSPRRFRVLTKGRRGAGHIEVPMKHPPAIVRSWKSMSGVNFSESERRIPDSELQRAAQLLSQAKRPLILAGGGVIAAESWRTLVEIAELLQAPVLMSPMGKGVIPADHPLCGGVTFTWVTADLQNMERSMSPLAGMADAALAVGFRSVKLAR